MKKSGKVWGETVQIVANSSLELHRIEVHPDTCCSIHQHAYKWNGFYCEKGRIMIRTKMDYGNGNELWDETILEAGEYTEVKPGHDHQFVAVGHEMAVVFEVYFANFQHDDIRRKSVGGLVQEKQKQLTPKQLERLRSGLDPFNDQVEVCVHCDQQNNGIDGAPCCADWDGNTTMRDRFFSEIDIKEIDES